VFTGSLAGHIGEVVDIPDDSTIAFTPLPSTNIIGHLQAHVSEICKQFNLGEYVRVIHGIHRGKDGYITEIHGSEASIFQRTTCEEVCLRHHQLIQD
jgi:hypothetical protein